MSHVFLSKYDGPCAADCGSRILTLQYITHSDDGVVHAECAEAAELGILPDEDQVFNDWTPEPLPDGPVTACPSCWLVGPCDCEEVAA
ncbi:MAG: hypothetical protein ABS888_00175 [Eubacteriales bacterium]